MRTSILTLSVLLFTNMLQAQISFNNGNNLLQNQSAHSGVAIVVSDVNGDGLDDIVRLDEGTKLEIEYQRSDQSGFDLYTFGQVASNSQWSMCVGDVDNNGINDILMGGIYDNIKIARAGTDGSSFELGTLPIPTIFAQGTNLVDINNDGLLDYFACHDDAESVICGNDGNGNLMGVDWIDMATVPASDNSGNYGSVWTDVDGDGDIDLYIAKCRSGVSNSSDPRRVNQLFVNDGAGNFTEAAAAANLNIGAQSWTAEFQDIDNDGDLDAFITNHDQASMLLENDGTGVFTNITANSGLNITGLPVQGIMRDFDNDGWVDVLVAGTVHHLFRNNGDKTFTAVSSPFGVQNMESFGVGDLNNDGYLDVYGGYAQLYTNPSSIDDVLWLNNGGSHHYLSMQLIGVQSNRNGIGAWVEAHGDWGVQIREVRSGESYGIGNSLMPHFGLGMATQVDSLVVKWPSGQVDIFTEIAANQKLTIIENTCLALDVIIEIDGSLRMCEGETVNFNAPSGYEYQWSTGATTQSIEVSNAGVFALTITDENGCIGTTQNITVVVNPDATPTVSADAYTLLCAGEPLNLQASEAESYLWSTGDTTQSIMVLESGEYSVTVPGLCGNFSSEPIGVDVIDLPIPEVQYVGIIDGNHRLVSTDHFTRWYSDETSVDPIKSGAIYTFPAMGDTSFTLYAERYINYPGPAYAAGMSSPEGNLYSGNQYNGGIIFDAYGAFMLKTVRVYTDTEASRLIELRSASGEVLASKEVVVMEGSHLIQLDFWVEAGEDLFLTTNNDHNQSHLGFDSPRFQRSSEQVSYPYVVDNILSITGSNLGENRYYYFFDWQIQQEDISCTSERVAIPFTLVHAAEEDLQDIDIELSPNPSNGLVHLELPETLREGAQVSVYHNSGQRSHDELVQGLRPIIDLSSLPAGAYWIVVRKGQLLGRKRLVLIK